MTPRLIERLARRDHKAVPSKARYLVGPFLGWLVLMTIWGFGRSGWPDISRWFLAVGLVAGAVTTALSWRHTAHLRTAPGPTSQL